MKNKGFTLIEIMIVVIIVGILAALAMPKLTKKLGEARSSEATTALGARVRALDSCYQTATAAADCDSLDEIGIQNPVSTNFTFSNLFGGGAHTATCIAGKCSGTITYTVACGTSSAATPGCAITAKAGTGDFAGLAAKWQ